MSTETYTRKAQTGEPGNAGQFGSHAHDTDTLTLSLLAQGTDGIWSPDTEKASVRHDSKDSGNWHVDLAPGGFVSFDTTRIGADPEDAFDELTIARDDDGKVTATFSLTGIDYNAVFDQQGTLDGEFDDEEDSADWLNARHQHIDKYLADTYGAVGDTDMTWGYSKISVTVDVTELSTEDDEFGAPLELPADVVRIQSWDAAMAVHASPGPEQLHRDIVTDGFYAKLRAHLDTVAP